MLKTILLVGTGGFIGTVARYLLTRWSLFSGIFEFPLGTLVVNVSGSLLLGFLVGLAEKGAIISNEWRLFLMVGLCGGFTTFSTFTGENMALIHNGQYLTMALYTGLSVFLGMIAVFMGYFLSKLL